MAVKLLILKNSDKNSYKSIFVARRHIILIVVHVVISQARENGQPDLNCFGIWNCAGTHTVRSCACYTL